MTPLESRTALPTPVDPPVETRAVLGTRVGYTSEGPSDGVPLLMVHGVPGNTRDFRYLAPLLAERCRVHRLELPGFGSNTRARWRDYSPWGRAELVLAFADAMGMELFAVLGHSIGGPVAILAAALRPERVAGLVAVASPGLRRHRGMFVSPRVTVTGLRTAWGDSGATVDRGDTAGAPERFTRAGRLGFVVAWGQVPLVFLITERGAPGA